MHALIRSANSKIEIANTTIIALDYACIISSGDDNIQISNCEIESITYAVLFGTDEPTILESYIS